ncbi:MAG: hypothetical protein R2939_03815 [Kofleriaceae bacterium]
MRRTSSILALLLAGGAAACGPDDTGPGGACVETLLPGDLVITEIFADAAAPPGGSGADEGKEWFEVYNASGRALDLGGLTLTLSRPDGSRAKSHVMRTLVVQPGDYVVLGNVLEELRPSYMDYGYAADLGDMFNTDGGQLALGCGSTAIDVAGYDEVVVGASQQFDGGAAPDYTANDDLANWCPASAGGSVEFTEANLGTPGDANEDCAVVIAGMCDDGGTLRPTVPPVVGDLVITEIMPSPDAVADEQGEWFEVLALADVDLNGLGLERAGDSRAPDVVTNESCLRVTAGTYVVFARSSNVDTNGGLADVAGTFGFTMVGGSAGSPGDVQLEYAGQVLDTFQWTGGTANGKSLQLDPDFATPEANDMERYWCQGSTTYGVGDLGTPGAANAECAILPAAGMCVDAGVERAIVTPGVGELILTEYMASPDAPQDKKEWVELANVSAAAFDLNGLTFDRTDDSANGALVTSADCLPVAPGGFALLARSADPTLNGELPAVDATFAFSLVNGSVATPCAVELRAGATVIDAASWIGAPSQKSRQLDPDFFDATANDLDDRPADPPTSNYCDGVGTYGPTPNTGTPKAANAECP